MTDLAGIQVFTEVARLGGFSAAARSLGLSKSTVTKQIQRLESRLQAKLLHRTTRSMRLTEVGQAYYERCRRIMEEAEEAELAVTRLHAEPVGRLRVSAPMSFGVRHVAKALPGFMARYPDVEVDIDLNDRRVDLVEEGFDVAIRIGELADSTLVAKKLAPCRMAVVASRDYWARHGKPERPEDLTRHTCLSYSLRRGQDVWRFEGAEGPVDIATKGPLTANNGDLLLAAAVAGVGIYICPTFFCDAGRVGGAGGGLEHALEDFPMPEVGIHAVWPPSRHLSAKVRAFVDYLADAFGPEPYWDGGTER